jgi:hypothetical protein
MKRATRSRTNGRIVRNQIIADLTKHIPTIGAGSSMRRLQSLPRRPAVQTSPRTAFFRPPGIGQAAWGGVRFGPRQICRAKKAVVTLSDPGRTAGARLTMAAAPKAASAVATDCPDWPVLSVGGTPGPTSVLRLAGATELRTDAALLHCDCHLGSAPRRGRGCGSRFRADPGAARVASRLRSAASTGL